MLQFTAFWISCIPRPHLWGTERILVCDWEATGRFEPPASEIHLALAPRAAAFSFFEGLLL